MRLRLSVESGKYMIAETALAFGGMAPTMIIAKETMKTLMGEEFCTATFEKAMEVLLKELSLPEVVPGGQAAYRMTLAVSFLHKFFLSCIEDLQVDLAEIKNNPTKFPEIVGDLPLVPYIEKKEISGKLSFLSARKPRFTGMQIYPTPEEVAMGLEEKNLKSVGKTSNAAADEVGKSVFHMSGPLHCTGEAQFADDIPAPEGCLHAALVLANECGRILKSIDITPALEIPGVVGVFGYEDLIKLGGSNELGPLIQDEVVFLPPGEPVRTHSQVLAIVVAESLESAEVGARLVNVTYGDHHSKVIVTVDDAIEAGSFYEFSRHGFERGDPAVLSSLGCTSDFAGTPTVGSIVKVSGSFRSGAQEHFYLEPHSTLVIPSESNTNLTIYCATQGAGPTQRFCSSATGTPASKVVVRVKRLGGGFGGKETRTVFSAAAAAVAAKLTSRPVRLTLGRDVDMKTTGTRHVFVSKYHASALVTESGAKLIALDVKLFSNGGSGIDVSVPILDRALLHLDGCYNFPNFRVEGIVCKTAQPPHTAFRGFGGPQGMAIAEHVLDHLAVACKVSGDELRRSNMYSEGDHTPYGMIVGGDTGKWNVPTMWDRLYCGLNVPQRRARINEFNANNKWVKRGLSIVPTKFGVAFTVKFMVSFQCLPRCHRILR
jgi:xanthine dehydrogenase/oxidase